MRDFRGVSDKAFDGRGNYSLGLREHTIFPELNLDKVEKVKGLTISIITTARSDFEGYTLLRALGMPFRGRERRARQAAAAGGIGRQEVRWRRRVCGSRRLRTPKFKVRQYNRCPLCGRSRAFYRRFKMCRLCLRKYRARRHSCPA